uniref:Uncharacterized protein n=1 Tax=Arundo donax TaxID=35708 RepID=A0A0A8ZHT5_ARUDO
MYVAYHNLEMTGWWFHFPIMGYAPLSVCLPALVSAPELKEAPVNSLFGKVTTVGRFAKPVRLALLRPIHGELSCGTKKKTPPCRWRERSPASRSVWYSVKLRRGDAISGWFDRR